VTPRFHERKGSAANISSALDVDGGRVHHGKNVEPVFTAVNRNRSLQVAPASFEASLREAPQDEEGLWMASR
jgi:hypothetical protein